MRCVRDLGLSELILQENAAGFVANFIRQKIKPGLKILFLCGQGNNASDALATARMLSGDYECHVYLIGKNLNQNAKIQLDIALKVGVHLSNVLFEADCVVDGIFGSGLNKSVSDEMGEIFDAVNKFNCVKIAIDIPSGIDRFGNVLNFAIRADYTIAMGALKLALFSDFAKDFVGEILLANLGLSHNKFANKMGDYLLEIDDLLLPNRDKKNVNKGDFGHAFIACGEMSGAAKMASKAALKMGAGRVSIVSKNEILSDDEIMIKRDFNGANAVAIGMGLGSESYDFLGDLPCVVDADMFYKKEVKKYANSRSAILTPHPKEFASLLEICGFGKFSVDCVQKDRFGLVRKFTENFPCTVVLKGANTIIANGGVLYIVSAGTPLLSVGGSGDVLCGIILAYLAQGFLPLEAAKNGVLAHAKTALNFKGNSYSFTPIDIIGGLRWL